MNFQDRFILAFVLSIWIVGTVYLFRHPDPETFAAWCALGATLGSTYHYLQIKDCKTPDAING